MFLTGLALKSTLVLACAWLITVLLRSRSAGVRHLVWTAAAAAVLVLPVLSISLPAWRVPVSAAINMPVLFQAAASAHVSLPNARTLAFRPVTYGSAPVGMGQVDWVTVALSIWIAVSLLLFARMLFAWTAIMRLRRSARPFPDGGSYDAGSIDVLEIPAGNMPMAFGILRSSILMPADASQWTEDRRRVVLLHELAHVRRGDMATHLLARLALIMYWWNPLSWIAWREFVKERERAADDLVLATGTPASDYARHLLDVARSMQMTAADGWVAVAMARRSQLETRLRAILDSGVNRTAAGRASALVTALLAIVLIAPLAAVRAQNALPLTALSDVDATIQAARSQKNYEMLDAAAKAAIEARQYDAAEKLLAVSAEMQGGGVGLVNLAVLQVRRHENEAAAATYTKAAQLLGENPAAAQAILYLGTSALVKKNYPQAIEYFQHAHRLDPGRAGIALMWSAVAMDAQHNKDEADALFRRAVAQQDPKSPEAVTILKVYGQFLHSQGRDQEATALEAREVTLPAKPAELSAGAYRIGGSVEPPKVIEKKEPEYTDEARVAKLTGTEVLFVEIGPDGIAHNIQVVRGLGLGLDENGVDAVSQWRFQPGKKDGQPVTVAATIEINWNLL